MIICSSVGWFPVISPTTSATAINPQLSSSDCCRQYLAAAARLPYTPLDAAGEAAADVVDGGLLDVLPVVVGDAAGVDDPAESLAGLHAVTGKTLATAMKAPTAAVRAAVAIRESNTVLIGPVNHQSACDTRVFPGKSAPHVDPGLSRERV
jgi:hypothetical protein